MSLLFFQGLDRICMPAAPPGAAFVPTTPTPGLVPEQRVWAVTTPIPRRPNGGFRFMEALAQQYAVPCTIGDVTA